jgi:hypothetical protein
MAYVFVMALIASLDAGLVAAASRDIARRVSASDP